MARGSVKPRPSKDGKRMTYRIKWETRDPNGKRRYHSATRRTKAEADKLLAEKLKEVNDGAYVAPSGDTVSEFLTHWLDATATGRSESSDYAYRSIVRQRIDPHIGAVRLARLNALTIQSLYATLSSAGYAPTTIRLTHAVLNLALERAVSWGILPRNPAKGASVPSAPGRPATVWSPVEATAFLEHTQHDEFAPLWRLALDSGMRIGEVLALTWRDFDRTTGTIAISRTLTRGKDGWRIGEMTKTASSRRSIVISASTAAALRRHAARQAERRLQLGRHWKDLGLIFDRGNGEILSPATVRSAFERSIAKSGVPQLNLHGMRHTMATLLLAAGVHPKVVQERLGHSSIQMTLDRYSHVSQSMQEAAAGTMERLLSGEARPERGHGAS